MKSSEADTHKKVNVLAALAAWLKPVLGAAGASAILAEAALSSRFVSGMLGITAFNSVYLSAFAGLVALILSGIFFTREPTSNAEPENDDE